MPEHHNTLGQPVGAPVTGWTERPRPPRTAIEGRYARIEPLSLPDSDPPQATLLTYAAEARFRAAWNLGDRDAIRTTAGELRLLMPRHPDAKGVQAVLIALTASEKDEALRAQINAMPRGARRDLLILKLMTLAPEREAILKTLLPTTGAGK